MDVLISIIIPIYKVEEYLEECIESVVNQTYKNLEIILVDDGSPDKCPWICDQWEKRDDRISVIHKKNGGLSDARNAGIEVAKGQYIGFVDSDDWIEPNMYERMLRQIQKEKADICACGIIDSYEDRQEIWKINSVVGDAEKILGMLYDNTSFPVAAWNKLYHRDCWENFRFPVGKICEDAFTTYLLVDKAKRIVQINDPLYHYRIREHSIMTAAFSPKRMDEEEAWRCNYEYMMGKHPQIYPKAFSFYLQKINVMLHSLTEEEKKLYKNEYEYLYGILKRNFWYVVWKSKLPIKYRVKFVMDFFCL